uniref:Ubiquitin-conjugating enzyme E2 G1 n=1 Tax=Lygus hesperus TaxID=30085 RepID=A0A0A9WHP0_LYGHE
MQNLLSDDDKSYTAYQPPLRKLAHRRASTERELPGDRILKKCKLSSNISSYGILLLQKQYKQLSKNPPDGMSFGLRDNDITRWRIIIEGPRDTIFEGGIFPVSLEFPDEYPNKPPVMRF